MGCSKNSYPRRERSKSAPLKKVNKNISTSVIRKKRTLIGESANSYTYIYILNDIDIDIKKRGLHHCCSAILGSSIAFI